MGEHARSYSRNSTSAPPKVSERRDPGRSLRKPLEIGSSASHRCCEARDLSSTVDAWLADFPSEPWGQIKGIGNRIRHEYFRVDDAILWDIITKDTHALKTVMEAMLARHASDGPSPKP
jgi:Protein of unknown function DUF86